MHKPVIPNQWPRPASPALRAIHLLTDVTTMYRELLRKQVSKKFYYGVGIRIL